MNRNIHFPTTIVDGFFENPDEIRKFALEQEFYPSLHNNFPGKRTKGMHLISPIILNATVKKIANLFFDPDTPFEFQVNATFQLVNRDYVSGWVHRDDPNIITAIVYLTPDNFQGTSLFRKKNYFMIDSQLEDKKLEAFKNQTNDCTSMKLHNEQFEETLNVKGIYNRLFLFDSIMFHGAHDFFGDDKEDSRLTLIIFFQKFSVGGNTFPISRMNMNSSPTIL